MGSPGDDKNAQKDEFPLHNLEISSFWIYKAEVTNEMYANCVEAGKCSPPKSGLEPPLSHYGDPAYAKWPVVGVDWYNAEAYCNFAVARLPTEAEWEKTARGTEVRVYPWGNDNPNCDLLNMKDCIINPPDTEQVNHFPVGRSQYKVVDMSGNVREWVRDWYREDYYDLSPSWNPPGPDQGTNKVIRGGSFKDPDPNVRNAARFSALPKDTFEDVGFRCIPVGESASAPFCKTSYKPFCRKPIDKPCVPTLENTPGKPTVTDFGCPKGEISTIMITTGLESSEGLAVTINGITYDCVPNPGFPGRLICKGPMPPANSYAKIEICPLAALPAADTAEILRPVTVEIPPNTIPGSKVIFNPSFSDYLVTVRPGGSGGALCSEGYEPNSHGECVPINKDKCPDGWKWISKYKLCFPIDKTQCPNGTTAYGAGEVFICTPLNSTCPKGYNLSEISKSYKRLLALAPVKYCYPYKENGPCQEGYRLNQDSGCCEPIPMDNSGCVPGKFHFSMRYNRCIPIKGDGCSYGQHYVEGQGCVDDYKPDDGTPILAGVAKDVIDTCPTGLVDDGKGNCVFPTTDCQPPLISDGKGGCSFPDQFMAAAFNYTIEVVCPPGETLFKDVCIPIEEAHKLRDCGPNASFVAAVNLCAGNDENGCPPGTYMDPKTGRCRPRTGAGSPCPYGYIYNDKTGCCVPYPGNEGSLCPGLKPIKQLPIPTDLTEMTTPPLAGENGEIPLYSTNMAMIINESNFDPMSGLCFPAHGQPCPPSYILKGDVCILIPWDPKSCPQGTVPDETYRVCRPATAGTCPPPLILDTSNDSCIEPPPPDCPTDTIAKEGNCYPIQGKDCPPGTTPGNDAAGNIICLAEKTATLAMTIPYCDDKLLYLDRVLGICVPRTPGCCQPGYLYNKEKGVCYPIKLTSTPPAGKECAYGTQWDDAKQNCVPYVIDGTLQECISFLASVPLCNGPCLAPLVWNGTECIPPGQPETPKKKTNPCTQWNNDRDCKKNGCSWQNNACS